MILDKITDDLQKNLMLAKMEREFVSPKELEQVIKNKLRKELQEILSDEEKANTRDQICATELNFQIFQKADERQKVRMEVQSQQLQRARNEQSMNNLALQFASTQQILLNCLSQLTPQLSVSMGLQNIERVSTLTENFESLSLPATMEEVLDSLQVSLIESLRQSTNLMNAAKEPPKKKAKFESSDEESGNP